MGNGQMSSRKDGPASLARPLQQGDFFFFINGPCLLPGLVHFIWLDIIHQQVNTTTHIPSRLPTILSSRRHQDTHLDRPDIHSRLYLTFFFFRQVAVLPHCH
ncbi:hypothetical protein MCOR13_001402 [Pyricularia oryzae]|nr:hypothetical protein MCOR13_001402 [Pyricularia oryzae]